MGGIGHKAAADLFRGLQPVGQLVELFRQMGQLIPARRVQPVAILPLAHNADRLQQGADPPGHDP